MSHQCACSIFQCTKRPVLAHALTAIFSETQGVWTIECYLGLAASAGVQIFNLWISTFRFSIPLMGSRRTEED